MGSFSELTIVRYRLPGNASAIVWYRYPSNASAIVWNGYTGDGASVVRNRRPTTGNPEQSTCDGLKSGLIQFPGFGTECLPIEIGLIQLSGFGRVRILF